MEYIDTKVWVIFFTIIFLAMQFFDRRSLRNLTKDIVGSFEDHVKESSEIKTLVKSLADAHSKVDDDGRPLWYMPRTMLDTQNELVKMSHTVAQTQKIICSMMKETRSEIHDIGEDIKEHAKECRAKT